MTIHTEPRSRWARCRCAAVVVLAVLSMVSCASDVGGDEAPCTPATHPFSADVAAGSRPDWASRWDEETLSAGAAVATSETATDDEILDRVLDCAGLSDDDVVPTSSGQRFSTVTVGVEQYLVAAYRVESAAETYVCGVAIPRTGDGSARFGVTAFEVRGGRVDDTPDGAVLVQGMRSNGIL